MIGFSIFFPPRSHICKGAICPDNSAAKAHSHSLLVLQDEDPQFGLGKDAKRRKHAAAQILCRTGYYTMKLLHPLHTPYCPGMCTVFSHLCAPYGIHPFLPHVSQAGIFLAFACRFLSVPMDHLVRSPFDGIEGGFLQRQMPHLGSTP